MAPSAAEAAEIIDRKGVMSAIIPPAPRRCHCAWDNAGVFLGLTRSLDPHRCKRSSASTKKLTGLAHCSENACSP